MPAAQPPGVRFYRALHSGPHSFKIIANRMNTKKMSVKLMGRGRLTENVKKFLDTLLEQWEELPPHFITSSLDKSGRDEVLDYISTINKSL